KRHLAYDEQRLLACRVGKAGDRLQEAVGARALSLTRRASVEVPERQLVERRRLRERRDLRLAAQVGRRLVSVEPDVLELELGHRRLLGTMKKAPRLRES